MRHAQSVNHVSRDSDLSGELETRPETVSRWRRLPAFQAEVRRVVELAQAGDTRARVEALLPATLDTLAAALKGAPRAPPLEVQAAAALLSFAAATSIIPGKVNSRFDGLI